MSTNRLEFPGRPGSDEIIKRIRDQTDTVLLGFSCGKDSIAAWLAIREHFTVIPYYCYLVPGLQFIEDSLAYYEKFFGARIIRVPNPSLYRMVNEMLFCPPERCRSIERLGLPYFESSDLVQAIGEDYGIPKERVWVANGVRAADSLTRRIFFKRADAINFTSRNFYPCWDWRMDELIARLKGAGVKLPPDYCIFGRSYDGIDFRFLKPISTYYPDDYKRILEWFPLAEIELKRHEFSKATY